MIDFADWINNQLQKRNWKQADLARESGVSRAAISDILSGKHKAGFQVCKGIASAFRLPVMEVFRAAGLVQQVSEKTPVEAEFEYLLSNLPADEQKRFLKFMQCFQQANK